MTTIGNYSVSIGLAADGLIQGGKLARNELSQLNSTIRSLVDPSEKIAKQFAIVEKAEKDQAISAEVATMAKERLRAKVEQLTQALQKQSAATQQASAAESTSKSTLVGTDGFAVVSGKLAAPIAGFLTLGKAVDVAKTSLVKFGEIEKSAAAFDVLTNSASKANQIMEETRKLAARGLSLSALNQSVATMLSFNVSMEDALPAMRSIAEITRGDTERLKMMSLAFAQAGAAGRLMGQDLLQMINAGFNPLQVISQQTGRSIADLRKDMEGGLITFAMVKDAFVSATEEGGKFNGMLDKMSETTAGSMMKISAQLENLQIDLGKALSPLAKEGIGAMQPIIDKAKETTDSIAGIVVSLAAFQGALASTKSTANEFFGLFTSELPALRDFMGFWKSLGQPDMGMERLGIFTAATDPAAMIREMGTAFDRLNSMTDETSKRVEALQRLANKGALTAAQESELAAEKENERIRKMVSARMEWSDKLQKEQPKTAPGPTAEEEKLRDRFETMRNSLSQQLETLKGGKTAATMLRAEMAGFNDQQKQAISSIAKEIEAIEKRNKAEKERTAALKERNSLQERTEREAAQLMARHQTEAEKLARTLAEIRRLQGLGALSPFEANRARQEAMKESVEKIKIEAPKSIDTQSQQGADFLANWRNQQISAEATKNQAQVNATKALGIKIDETNRRLAAIENVQPRNRR